MRTYKRGKYIEKLCSSVTTHVRKIVLIYFRGHFSFFCLLQLRTITCSPRVFKIKNNCYMQI